MSIRELPMSDAEGQNEQKDELMKVALGEAAADLAIINGTIVNVYTGELISGNSVLAKNDKIACVAKDISHAIGTSTRIIDAADQILIPGFIDGHTHLDIIFSISEVLKYAIKGGTTTIITDTANFASILGYKGVIEFIKSITEQPIKVYVTAPPAITFSPVTAEHATTVNELNKLLKRKEVISLGEPYWSAVVGGDTRVLDLITTTIKMGKKVNGHSAGARGNKLQAYLSSGVSSCHESITAEEALERLRLGLFVLIREGEIRRDLEEVSKISKEKIYFNRLALATDGIGPRALTRDGYMEFLVQKAINCGFDPVLAIRMATINTAQHFGIDDITGGIAPGKYADIVIIPDLKNIRAEYVISKGQVVAQDGQIIVQPRKHIYSRTIKNTVHLDRTFNDNDFIIPAKGSNCRVRIIDQVTDLVTTEESINMLVSDGQLKSDIEKDILKVAAIERVHGTAETFISLIRGIGLKKGAIATSTAWDCGDIIVVGASDNDMAQAVNRIIKLRGGIVVSADNNILAELSLPVAGMVSTEPMETLAKRLNNIQQSAIDLGCKMSDIYLTLSVLASPAIPFLRINECGLFNMRQNQFVDFIQTT